MALHEYDSKDDSKQVCDMDTHVDFNVFIELDPLDPNYRNVEIILLSAEELTFEYVVRMLQCEMVEIRVNKLPDYPICRQLS